MIFGFFNSRNNKIQLHFSEITQIEKENKSINPTTKYLASINDMTMKVFECWNYSIRNKYLSDDTKTFAAELEERMLPSFKQYNYEIFDYTDEIIPIYTNILLNIFKNSIFDLRKLVIYILNYDKVWQDEHDDHYHTELRTRTSTGTNGNIKTEVYTVRVYDYTTHSYYYNKIDGIKMQYELDKTYNFLNIKPLDVYVSSKVNAENYNAIKYSVEDDNISENDISEFANSWASKSNIRSNFNNIINSTKRLELLSKKWHIEKDRSKNVEYNTYSSYDDGPIGFIVYNQIKNESNSILNNINQIQNILEKTKTLTAKLDSLIKKFIDIKLNLKDGDGEELKDEILNVAIEIHEINFNENLSYRKLNFSTFLFYFIIGILFSHVIFLINLKKINNIWKKIMKEN